MMATFRWKGRLAGLPVVLVLLLVAGCSRPSDLPAGDGTNAAEQNKLPFRDEAAKGTGDGPDSADGNGSPEAEHASDRDVRPAGAPFQHLTSVPELPGGTLISVRLEKPVSNDRVGKETSFAAVVDEPVLVDGKVAVPPGATVTGTLQSAMPSDVGPGRGYLRLSLDTIVIAGKKLPLRTSSLFLRGVAGEVVSSGPVQDETATTGAGETRLQKGRRLTFRLATTVPLYVPETVSRGQGHLPGSQE